MFGRPSAGEAFDEDGNFKEEALRKSDDETVPGR